MSDIVSKESKSSKKLAVNSIGYGVLIIGGLIAKFSLLMWFGIIGYTLIVFGIVILMALNE